MGQTQSASTKEISYTAKPAATTSELYLACRNGDLEKVENLLPTLTDEQLNKIEPNGSTALHAASYYGHGDIVRVLLKRGCTPWLLNKYKMTAYQEAANDEIRVLFHRRETGDLNRFVSIEDSNANDCLQLVSNEEQIGTVAVQDTEGDECAAAAASALDNEDDIPQGWVDGYRNISNKDRATAVKRIVRAQMMQYCLKKFQISDSVREVQSILKKNVSPDHEDWSKANNLFTQFQQENSIQHLIRLYTLETPFYGALHENIDSFAIEMYTHLIELKDRAYKGQTYRGLTMSNSGIRDYRWAAKNCGNLIEIKTLTSTSIDSQVAENFARKKQTDNKEYHRVVCVFDFPQICITAINLSCIPEKKLQSLSAYEVEKEVLVLPGTLFEVKDVQKATDTGRYTIVLENVPVPRKVLMAALKEFQDA